MLSSLPTEHHVPEISVPMPQDPGVDEWEAGQLARTYARWHLMQALGQKLLSRVA